MISRIERQNQLMLKTLQINNSHMISKLTSLLKEKFILFYTSLVFYNDYFRFSDNFFTMYVSIPHNFNFGVIW